jgi:S1-C subfamily serine protease
MGPVQGCACGWLGVLLWLLASVALAEDPELRTVKAKAEGGDVEAQFQLAMMYDLGIGTPKSYTESGKWYLKAASGGVAEAQFQLGVRYYEHGKKAKENYVTAFSWFFKAASQGMAEAQHNIALMYQLGRGAPTNRIEAYKWYLIAAAQGYPKALMARDTLATDLTRQEMLEGERRATTFEPKRVFRAQGALAQAGEEPKASGTGFFVTDDGYLVTNFHVVSGFTSFNVKTKKGTFPARLVRTDETNDLALLKVLGSFSALPVGSSAESRLGDQVFTIGFPNMDVQGLEPKLTRGDISSLAGIKDDPRHFQISVPVQPGNSGGPLVALNGNVVGVVTMRLGDWRTFRLTGALPQNVNYALKSSLVRKFVDGVPEAAGKMKSPASAGSRKFEDVVKDTGEAVGIVLSY